ncbi:MAG: hypothetical protein LBQ24_02175 [Candidatus Peribacteria bacterium]|nr:hypothetical protein [Candidatus Peribacteria bacterium]
MTDCVVININKEDYKKIKTKDFLKYKMPENKKILVENDSLSPSNLVVKDGLFKIYKVLEKKLEHINLDNILFEDFILSLVPEKYWHKSFFFLKSKFTPKIKDFFNTYNDIISLHIPIARSLYMKDFFEALLLQINKNFRLLMCVDGYDEKQKNDIIAVIEKYKDRFSNFEYLVNEKNL